jgi:DNA-binding transcriptional regulator YdaS (Cro superfamily)
MDKFTEYLDAERGRRVQLARDLGIQPSAVSMWDRVPTDRVLDVERITGISRHELRPDVFGAAPVAANPPRAAAE